MIDRLESTAPCSWSCPETSLGNYEHIVTNDSGADLTSVVKRKMSRWSVETLFRDPKQYGGWRRANAGWIRRWFATSASSCLPSWYCR